MNDYTVPNPAVAQSDVTHKAQAVKMPEPHSAKTVRNPIKKPKKRRIAGWLWLVPVAFIVVLMLIMVTSLIAINLAYANQIFPNVSVGGYDLGGMTIEEAEIFLGQHQTIMLSDGHDTVKINMQTLGLTLDAQRSAQAAFAPGHTQGGLGMLFQSVDVPPIIDVNADVLRDELQRIAPNFEVAAANAGVTLINGQVQATDPQIGRRIDIEATIAALLNNPGSALADGQFNLVMQRVQPAIMDSSSLVQQAEVLLGNPLDIRVFDPVTGDSVYWSLLPEQWGSWLQATPDPNSTIGLALELDNQALKTYLEQQSTQALDISRSIDVEAAAQSIRDALAVGRPQDGFVRVQHHPRTHVIQRGETISSIGWDYGMPYLYLIEANGGRDSFDVGETIQIPPADVFLNGDVSSTKRVVVDLSEQKTRAYENGELIYEWISSTGIDRSPTWTGIYQILSHAELAYAGNWNLYMPYFIGIYNPVPGSAFENGFHGFPTRGGGQLLWENDLGHRVTYGCVLLSDEHVKILYDWAEEGVVVEIRT